MTGSRLRALSLGALAALAGLVLLAWSQPWFTLALAPASGDGAPLVIRGDAAAGALAPLALTTLAVVAALAISGPVFRVVLGVLAALVGVSIAIVAIVTLADPVAAASSAVTEATGLSGHDAVVASVVGVDASVWPGIAVALGGLLAVAGAATAVGARRWPVSGRRYSRTRAVPADGATEPDAVADWDALSDGDDPTAPSR